MNCVICKNGETAPGNITVTLERNGVTLVVRGVPADVCQNCGEEYVSHEVTRNLLQKVKDASAQGAHLDVREYVAA
jgi:YgiT-type zinc finger domain-containing protein